MSADGQHLRLGFLRSPRRSDITCTVEASEDLINWTPIATSVAGAATINLGGANAVTESAASGATEYVVVEDGAVSGAGRRFLHLKVSRP